MKKLCIALLVLSLFISSCEKEKDTNTTSSFSWEANGVLLQGTSTFCDALYSVSTQTLSAEFFPTPLNGNHIYFQLYHPSVLAPGTHYQLAALDSLSIVYHYSGPLYNTFWGKLHLTQVDTDAHLISGTFEIKQARNSSDTVIVTNGTFTNVCYELTD